MIPLPSPRFHSLHVRGLLRKLLTALLVFAALAAAEGPGFRSRSQFEEHYRKHGPEFGRISQQEYLRLAQELRDARPGGPILEAVRSDGAFSRFDRHNGYFGAFNRDRTIRTFFIPNDGERYFRRQIGKSH